MSLQFIDGDSTRKARVHSDVIAETLTLDPDWYLSQRRSLAVDGREQWLPVEYVPLGEQRSETFLRLNSMNSDKPSQDFWC